MSFCNCLKPANRILGQKNHFLIFKVQILIAPRQAGELSVISSCELMNTGITIKTELQHKGSWIKINIPLNQRGIAKAVVSSPQGEIFKTVMLEEGNNAIDISGVSAHSVHVKVETACETVLKNLKLNDK